MTKHISLAALEELCQGWRANDYSITTNTPEEAQKIKTKLLMLQGAFETYSPEQQEKAVWRARAVVYFEKFYGEHRLLGKVAAADAVANNIGCGGRSVFNWQKSVLESCVGAAYWPLFLLPERNKAGLATHHPKVWLRIQELLSAGRRPSNVVRRIKEELDVTVSIRTVQRLGKSEEAAGHLKRVNFINRFE